MTSVSARRGPGWTVVSQTILGDLVGCRGPGSRPGVDLLHLGVPDVLRLADGVQEDSSNTTRQLGQSFLMSPSQYCNVDQIHFITSQV